MASLDPIKLHTRFVPPVYRTGPLQSRSYTLTHSDRTGDLFLTIADDYDRAHISGWYTRLMRDEVLACWLESGDQWCLDVHCHISGGIVLGTAAWRAGIFRYHMPQVLQAFRFGDQALFSENPALDQSEINVHFHARQEQLNQVESWGEFGEYRINL